MERDRSKFIEVIKEGWRVKKQTSENILQHSVLKRMDEEYENNKAVLCHRLCGAGNGGFFLIFCDKGAKSRHKKGTSLKIDIDFDGAKVVYGGGK
jgi:galactokinase/mevalonate kinase-like predicted kinase